MFAGGAEPVVGATQQSLDALCLTGQEASDLALFRTIARVQDVHDGMGFMGEDQIVLACARSTPDLGERRTHSFQRLTPPVKRFQL
jgi:hypothetical protein